uniref:hypothetical protein n=1 Tax=uncultured Draconibacterium sp. TaxID=1573823 RepID=UPI003217E3F0
MTLLKKLYTATIILFLVIGCENADDIKSTDLTINLNPGQGLTLSELDGLTIGIIRLPDGATKNDDLDNLEWTSEPEWIISTSSNLGKVTFNDIDAGLYLVQIDNESMKLETFFKDSAYAYIQVSEEESNSYSINIVLKEVENTLPSTDFWGPAESEGIEWELTLYCYNKNDNLTKSSQVGITNQDNQAGTIVGSYFQYIITDPYYFSWGHHYLRDDYYKLRIEITNKNDGTTISKIIYPNQEQWRSKTYFSDSINVGNNKIRLNCVYDNKFGMNYPAASRRGIRRVPTAELCAKSYI